MPLGEARPFLNNCAINEQTGDGQTCGRCWHNVLDGVCPRHGDVRVVQKRYAETGKLTLENEHRKAAR
jgi:hypothetical protein